MRISRLAALLMAFVAAPASAQLMLHNSGDAPAGTPEAAAPGAAPSGEAPKPKPVPMKPPSDDSVVGHDLLRDGSNGAIALGRQGKDLGVTRLALEGEEISKPGERCHIDVNSGLPLTLHFDGRPSGLTRYKLDLPACPFSFDVLDGAILVARGQACDFTAADCHVDPAGLWGPQGNSFGQAKAREMEASRLRIETDMRANFRVLLSHAGKDKAAVKRIAGEQAGFSSTREELCHSYAYESTHGFCALEITRARVLALLAQLGSVSDKAEETKPPVKKKPKPPAVAAQPSPPALPPQ